jgi:hypothetical protein
MTVFRLMTQPRKSIQRRFTGLVGRYDPPEPLPPAAETTEDSVPTPAVEESLLEEKKSKAAQRAQRWRRRQTIDNPNFHEQERVRKEQERGDKDREAEIAAVLAAKEPMLTVINADGKQTRVITGGCGSTHIAEMSDQGQQADKMEGRRVTAQGAAPANFDADAKKYKRIREYDDDYVRAAFKYARSPVEVRVMKEFVYTNVEKYRYRSSLTVCSHCKAEISPFPQDVPLLALQHLLHTRKLKRTLDLSKTTLGSRSARSTSWAECRDKKGSAPSRRREMSLDIPSPETSSRLCQCDLEA